MTSGFWYHARKELRRSECYRRVTCKRVQVSRLVLILQPSTAVAANDLIATVSPFFLPRHISSIHQHTFQEHPSSILHSAYQPKMSSQPQPQPTFPGFPRIFHALETLKAHLVSLQQGLILATQDQQQPYHQTQGYPPGPPPQYGLPPSGAALSPLVLPSPTLSHAIIPYTQNQNFAQGPVSPIVNPAQPHPHVYGHGYVQARSFGGTSQEQALAQISAAREAIAPANAELNQAIGALRRGADDVYERYADFT